MSKWRRLVERNFKDSHFTPFLLCFPARVLPDYVDGLGELFQVLLLSLPALILHHLPGGQELIIKSYFRFFHALEAADVVTEDLCALSLVHQVLRQQLQLHDHVGKPGGDLLLQEMERTLKCKKNDHNPDFIL